MSEGFNGFKIYLNRMGEHKSIYLKFTVAVFLVRSILTVNNSISITVELWRYTLDPVGTGK